MSESFDAYYRWLGIPPHEQPPHHYRMLGITAFEADLEVITDAADRQMAHVRTYQLGPQADRSQTMLNEIAAARVCLLNPQKKAAYDTALRQQLAPQAAVGFPSAAPVSPPLPPAPARALAATELLRSDPTPNAASTSPAPDAEPPVDAELAQWLDGIDGGARRAGPQAKTQRSTRSPAENGQSPAHARRAGKGPGTRWPRAWLAVAAGAAFASVVSLGLLFSMRAREGTLVVEISDPEATVQVIDGQGKLLIEQKAGAENVEISVVPGRGTLRVVKNGVELIAKEFSLVSGGRETINARLVAPVVAKAAIPKPEPAVANPQSPVPPPAVAPFDADKAKEHQEAWAKHLGLPVDQTNSIGMKLALIPPGEFDMGSTPEDVQWALEGCGTVYKEAQWYIHGVSSEAPRHRVKITKPFYLGICDVTQAEYEKVMGVNPSEFTNEKKRWAPAKDTSRLPVDMVNWDDATEFCHKLSALPAERAARRGYRLPTEAEWEYACRAGTTTRWYCGDDDVALDDAAWFRRNFNGMTHPVGEKKPNAWGLYDMYGNVWQLCADWFSQEYYRQSPQSDPAGPAAGSLRVLRGGSCFHSPCVCRSAIRIMYPPATRFHDWGFRVVEEKAEGGREKAEGGTASSSPVPNPQSTTPSPPVPPPADPPSAPNPTAPAKLAVQILPVPEIAAYAGEDHIVPVRIERHGFEGPVGLRLEGLPQGLTSGNSMIPAGQSRALIDLAVPASAGRAETEARVVASCENAITEAPFKLVVGRRPAPPPLVVPLNGLGGQQQMMPITFGPDPLGFNKAGPAAAWQAPGVFARLSTKGAMGYPRLPVTHYVMEIELAFLRAETSAMITVGDLLTAVKIDMSWNKDLKKIDMQVRTYRYHGWNWSGDRYFDVGDALTLKLVVLDDRQVLCLRNKPILDARAWPADLGLLIWSDGPDSAVIRRCSLRAIREEDVQVLDCAMPQLDLALDPAATKARLDSLKRGLAYIPVKEKRFLVLKTGTPMAWIAPGEFDMGSRDPKVPGRHRVRISRGFWMGQLEVTQGEWTALMPSNPSRVHRSSNLPMMRPNPSRFHGSPYLPVDSVTWQDAVQFCEALNKIEFSRRRPPPGYFYRLPTDAEWEYACRAGSQEEFSVKAEEVWSRDTSGARPHEVGEKSPNAWGLYDMHGNAMEWCADAWYDYPKDAAAVVVDPFHPGQAGRDRFVVRGGAWWARPDMCRSSWRDMNHSEPANGYRGFRIVLGPTLNATAQ